jgi:plasmid stabilization system protein ParE
MARSLKWRKKALQELHEIGVYCAEKFSENVALEVIAYLRAQAFSLTSLPNLGRLSTNPEARGRGIRILVAKQSRIAYFVTKDEVVILRIFDARGNPSHFDF